MTNTTYVLGHDPHEARRLDIQSRTFAEGTERILRAAGLRDGQSVLDIGTGAGDVAEISARLTGSTGSVLGIDQSPVILEIAYKRAAQAKYRNIEYLAVPFEEFRTEARFDVVVGRYVLVHQRDPVSFIRRAATFVRTGGTLVFIEPNIAEISDIGENLGERWSNPPVALYDETVRQVIVAFGLAGVGLSRGGRLLGTFQAAGLAAPKLLCEVPMAGSHSEYAEWITLTLRSLLPVLERHKMFVPDHEKIETLQTRLQNSIDAAQSQLRFADLVGAWTTVLR